MTGNAPVLYAEEDGLVRLTLNRPEARNALGPDMLAELLLTGEIIDAEAARRIGLVNRVASPGELHAEAEGLARVVLARSPAAVRLTWEAMLRGLDLPLEESALLGADLFGRAAAADDFRTRTRAFLEETRRA